MTDMVKLTVGTLVVEDSLAVPGVSTSDAVVSSSAVVLRNGAGHALLAYGTAVPSDAAAGYAKGCLFIKTDGTNHTNTLYANIGSGSSANFNAVTIASD